MNKIAEDTQGKLTITPSKSSSQNDFDFLAGKWNIHNKKLISRLANSNEWIEFDAVHEMRKVLAGIGNIENISATLNEKAYEGMTVRLFNPATKLWSIYWADNISGTMDNPVVGSFEKNTGTFFSKEMFNNKEIILQFKWDATNPEKPVWSQAFSADNGKTWEWNWYMYFSRRANETGQNLSANQNIKVIEIRNYIIKPGQRDNFINLFEANFIQPQQATGSYTLGQYKIKGSEDNFFWIRGFHDMASRNKALNDFYSGSVWKQNRITANSMIMNSDNVNLLKPLNLKDSSSENELSFNTNWFGKDRGIAVVDFYISNTKLGKLIEFVKKKYVTILNNSGIENTSFWVSETSTNEFTILPVFQDKNLLVQITFYKDEFEYQTKMKLVDLKMNDELKTDMADLVTLKNTLIVYPTEKSFMMK